MLGIFGVPLDCDGDLAQEFFCFGESGHYLCYSATLVLSLSRVALGSNDLRFRAKIFSCIPWGYSYFQFDIIKDILIHSRIVHNKL